MTDETIQYLALMANHISRLRTFPYLDIVHYIKMCLLFREGNEGNSFTRKYIFGSWCLSILMCFSGSVVSNFLAGEPISTPFKYQENMAIATLVWYFINFFPKDLVYKSFKIQAVEIILSCIWNVYLVNKIQSGVSYGIKHFPDAYVVAAVLGMAKGCGDVYLHAVVKLAKGTFETKDNVILYLPEQVKCSIVSSVFMVLSHYYQLPGYNKPFVFLSCLLLFIHTTISRLAFDSSSVFSPFESILYNLMFKWGPRPQETADEEVKETVTNFSAAFSQTDIDQEQDSEDNQSSCENDLAKD